MKGMVFTEFLEMVDAEFGWEVADTIIDESDLPSGGAYTSVGTYPHTEMVSLVQNLSKKTDIAIPELLKVYGRYLFKRFNQNYGVFFYGISSAFDFLQKVEDYIHVEVLKLYPEAELPNFKYERPTENQLIMYYQSERPFADFAEGLIEGCILHYNESINIEREDLPVDVGSKAKFILSKIE